MDTMPGLVIAAIVGIFALGTILSGFFQVRTAEAVVVQRMGEFQPVASTGINFKLPWLDLNGHIDAPGDLSSLVWMWKPRPKTNVFVKTSRFRCRCSITSLPTKYTRRSSEQPLP